KERLERLQERLKREQENYFFTCKNKCMRIGFENAVEFQYKCPECGELLIQEDNAEKIKEIQKDIKDIEKFLKTL
ncbi:transcription initiation factor E subunit alpha, partial [Candidatus Woesearchaeota archaeon]|nr:transcription initiation factor E subunit alpha [Candidatus Woesearchaeota archaeon]